MYYLLPTPQAKVAAWGHGSLRHFKSWKQWSCTPHLGFSSALALHGKPAREANLGKINIF